MNSFLVEIFNSSGSLISSHPFEVEKNANPDLLALQFLNSVHDLTAWAYVLKLNTDNDSYSIISVLEKNNQGQAFVKSTLYIDQEKIVKTVNLSADKKELIVSFTNGIVHESIAVDEGAYNCDDCRYFSCELGNLIPDTYCRNVDSKEKNIIWIAKEGSDLTEIEDVLEPKERISRIFLAQLESF